MSNNVIKGHQVWLGMWRSPAMLEGVELWVRSCSELRARELLLEGGVVNLKAPPISTPVPAHGGGKRSWPKKRLLLLFFCIIISSSSSCISYIKSNVIMMRANFSCTVNSLSNLQNQSELLMFLPVLRSWDHFCVSCVYACVFMYTWYSKCDLLVAVGQCVGISSMSVCVSLCMGKSMCMWVADGECDLWCPRTAVPHQCWCSNHLS